MHTQRGTRRSVLGALAGLLAGTMASGIRRAVAVEDDGARPRPDYGSKEAFKLECELLGGTFSEDGIGNTNCDYPGGGNVQCDANGNDCWHTPASGPRPSGGHHQYPFDGHQDAVATDAPPNAEEPDDDHEPPPRAKAQPDKGKGKGKKGKRGKRRRHGGKKHRHGGKKRT